jgi:transcriptional regulator with XRE-family HTH domain
MKQHEIIRAIRKQRGMSLEELAKAASIGYTQLSKIENGHATGKQETIAKIFNALNAPLPVVIILTIDEDMIKSSSKKMIWRKIGPDIVQAVAEIFDLEFLFKEGK